MITRMVKCSKMPIASNRIHQANKTKSVLNQPQFLPKFLYEMGVRCVVAGGMGMRAQGLFREYGIEAVVGISGKIVEIIEKLQKGTLEGGQSLCRPGAGKGYGVETTECDHPHEHNHEQ